MARSLAIISRITGIYNLFQKQCHAHAPNELNNLSDLLNWDQHPVHILWDKIDLRENRTKVSYKHFNFNIYILQRSQLTNITGQIENIPDLELEMDIILTGNIQQLLCPKN